MQFYIEVNIIILLQIKEKNDTLMKNESIFNSPQLHQIERKLGLL